MAATILYLGPQDKRMDISEWLLAGEQLRQ
jgi:hypothetical protein